jgi:predicted alpha/beta-hydrolase family hydrolase
VKTRFEGPRAGADRAVLLAHGAGADLDATPLRAVATALAAAGIPSLRFNFPYRDAGRRAPDRPPVLLASVRDAAARLAKRTGLPPERIVLGGRSMGGRMCSLLVGSPPDDDPLPALGLLLLGYPLHPAGKPMQLRIEHFPRLRVPCLFVSGTRDSLAGRDALTTAAKAIKGRVRFEWLESADHGFRPLKSSGVTAADVLHTVGEVSTAWVAALRVR